MISHNILYRLIRLSSPNLNYIIGLGAIVLYLNVIILVVPTAEPHVAVILCNVRMYIPAYSSTLFIHPCQSQYYRSERDLNK